jgi:signal transduction histidine kinase/CheY-like chemotaxis protein
MHPTFYLGILVFTSLLSLALSIECFIYRAVGSAKKLFFLMLSISAWAFFMYLAIIVTTIPLKHLFHDFLFIAVILTPYAFFKFVYSYTSEHRKGPFQELIHLLFIIPAINIAILLTNPLHHLFFTDYALKPFGQHLQLVAEFNAFFWVHTLFAYGLTLISIVLLTVEFISNRRYFKRQILLLIIGAITPVITNVIFLIDKDIAQYDFTPVSLLISGLFFGYAINRYQIFSSNPISRKLTLHSIHDSVLILDDEGMIVEYNNAFEKQFDLDRDFRYAASQTLPLTIRRILAISANEVTYNQQVRVADEESQVHYFKVKKIPVLDKASQFSIYILTDANNTSLLLKAVEQKQQALQGIRDNKLRFLSTISHELRAPLNTLKSVADLLGEKKIWSSSEQQQLANLAKGLHHKTNLILDYAKIEANEMKCPTIDIPIEQFNYTIAPYAITCFETLEIPQFIVAPSTVLPLVEHLTHAVELLKVSQNPELTFCLKPAELNISAVFETKRSATIFDSLMCKETDHSLLIEERLHLSLVKSLVTLSKGQITLEPISLIENKLSIQIPLSLGYNKCLKSQVEESPHLLLIDDSLITFFICQKFCNQQNILLDYAENLANAQTLLKKDTQYKWILLDLHLENASGFDVVHQLKNKQTTNTLFVAISSDQFVIDPDHSGTHGFDHFIQKPIKLADFISLSHVTKTKQPKA